MLKYNFGNVFTAKGIEKPFKFLCEAGFSASFATKLKNNRLNRIELGILEKLCISMGCTPNDFLEWTPDKGQVLDKSHPIHELNKAEKILDISRTLHSLPLSKLEDIEKLINEDD